MAAIHETSLNVKISRGTQVKEHHLADHLRAHPVTSKAEKPISEDEAIFYYHVRSVAREKNASTQIGKNGPYGKRTKPNSLKTLEPSAQCLESPKKRAEEDLDLHACNGERLFEHCNLHRFLKFFFRIFAIVTSSVLNYNIYFLSKV